MWIIMLDSGGQCYDQGTCSGRAQSSLSSSNYFSNSISLDGIYSNNPSDSPMWGSNKVFIPYCSSDGWIGDVGAGDVPFINWSFRGQRIVRATLRDLVASGKMRNGARVLFGGMSAGARGMMNNVDFLHAYLPPESVILGAFLDSPLWINVPTVNGYIGTDMEMSKIVQYFNVSAIIPRDCANAYSNDLWKCITGEFRMSFLKTPYVLVASQRDSYQLGKYGYHTSELQTLFANHTVSNLLNLSRISPAAYIMSWSYLNHGTVFSSDFHGLVMPGSNITERTLVDRLLSDAPYCLTYTCGMGNCYSQWTRISSPSTIPSFSFLSTMPPSTMPSISHMHSYSNLNITALVAVILGFSLIFVYIYIWWCRIVPKPILSTLPNSKSYITLSQQSSSVQIVTVNGQDQANQVDIINTTAAVNFGISSAPEVEIGEILYESCRPASHTTNINSIVF